MKWLAALDDFRTWLDRELMGDSGQDALRDVPSHVGQTEIPALVLVSQLRVTDAEQMQHRRVQIVDMHRILGDVVGKVSGLAEGDSRFDASAGHPDGEAPRVMIAPVVVGGELSLAVD